MAVCPICGEGCGSCPDPRDAEIARLKGEVARIRVEADEAIVDNLVTRKRNERLIRALAAGPADLRWRGPMSGGEAAKNVEAAQAAAMKDDTKKDDAKKGGG